jgi:hypothetical protein
VGAEVIIKFNPHSCHLLRGRIIPTTEIPVNMPLTRKLEMLTFTQFIYYSSKLVYNRLYYFTINNKYLFLDFLKRLPVKQTPAHRYL